MSSALINHAAETLRELESQGLAKHERTIVSPQGAEIRVRTEGEHELLNLCANNYLGLAQHPGGGDGAAAPVWAQVPPAVAGQERRVERDLSGGLGREVRRGQEEGACSQEERREAGERAKGMQHGSVPCRG